MTVQCDPHLHLCSSCIFLTKLSCIFQLVTVSPTTVSSAVFSYVVEHPPPLPTETISIYRLETTFQIADCYIKCMKNSVKTLTPASGLPESHTCPSVGSETLTPAHKWSPRPPSCPPGVSQTSTPAAQVSQTPTPARQWSPKRPPCPSGVSLTLIPARQVSP